MSKPYEVDVQSVQLEYYKEECWNAIRSTFRVTELPDRWRARELLKMLLDAREIAVFDTYEIGLVYNTFGYGSESWDGGHGTIIVTSRFYEGGEYVIYGQNPNAVIFRIPINFHEIVDHYAAKLAHASGSLLTNFAGAKIAHVFVCDGNASIQRAKAAVEEIQQGSPAVFLDGQISKFKEDPSIAYNPADVARSYIGDKLLDGIETIWGEFLRAVGIPSITRDKKERLISGEASANDIMCRSLREHIQESLDRSAQAMEAMFGERLHIDAMGFMESEVDNNETADTQTDTRQ